MKKPVVDTTYKGSWAEQQATKAYKLPAKDDVPAIFPGSKHVVKIGSIKWEDRDCSRD